MENFYFTRKESKKQYTGENRKWSILQRGKTLLTKKIMIFILLCTFFCTFVVLNLDKYYDFKYFTS